MMSKRAAASIGVAVALLVVLCVAVYEDDWIDPKTGDSMNDEGMKSIDYGNHDSDNTDPILDDDDNLSEGSLNYKVFEEYGPLLLVLALLMFGAIVGGICVAREEDETDDTD